MLDFDILKNLCTLSSPSGYENEIRNFIIDQISNYSDDIYTDTTGNIIVFKKGSCKRSKKLALFASMDEKGLIISDFTENGCLKFKTIGNLSASDIVCRKVKIGTDNLNGVIGSLPTHILSSDKKNTPISLDELCIDIGAYDEEQAKQYVSLGDIASFCEEYKQNKDKIFSKALDRIGCFLLISLIKTTLKYDTHFVFTTLSNINSAGIKTSSYRLQPDVSFLVDAVSANDSSDQCFLTKGVTLTFAGKNIIYDKPLLNLAKDLANQNNIQFQLQYDNYLNSEAVALMSVRSGTRILRLSTPIKYKQSILMSANFNDINNHYKLLSKLVDCNF